MQCTIQGKIRKGIVKLIGLSNQSDGPNFKVAQCTVEGFCPLGLHTVQLQEENEASLWLKTTYYKVPGGRKVSKLQRQWKLWKWLSVGSMRQERARHANKSWNNDLTLNDINTSQENPQYPKSTCIPWNNNKETLISKCDSRKLSLRHTEFKLRHKCRLQLKGVVRCIAHIIMIYMIS